MALGGRAEGTLGCEVSLDEASDGDLKNYQKLFSETGGFVVEVAQGKEEEFEGRCNCIRIGKVTSAPKIVVKDLIDMDLSKARSVWWDGLREKL